MNGYTESAGQRNPAVQSHTVSGLIVGTSYNLTNRLAADFRYQRDLVTLTSTSATIFQGFQAGLNWQLRHKE